MGKQNQASSDKSPGFKPLDTSIHEAQEKARIIRKSGQGLSLLLDIFMVWLILINISWVFFDTLFESKTIQEWVYWLSPSFFDYYSEKIHPDFLKYDLYFISIYVTDIVIRWIIAIRKNTYHRWFFFPFANWYDVLGCIPVSGFHLLRLLRIFVILRRLQKIGVIDFSDTYLYKVVRKYVNVITEEVSDRVVVQVLNGVQAEVERGTPMLHKIIDEVVLTRRLEIGHWISQRMTDLVEETFEHRRQEIYRTIHGLVQEAANRTHALNQLQKVPLLGDRVQTLLEESVASMVYEISEQIIMYFKGDESTQTVHEFTQVIFDSLADPNNQLNHIFQVAITDALELVKEQVKIQQWKLNQD